MDSATRLRVLGQKLGHAIPEIRLRAIRNLQAKLSTGILEAWVCQGAGDDEEGEDLYRQLTAILATSEDDELVREVLHFVDGFTRKVPDTVRVRMVRCGVLEALQNLGARLPDEHDTIKRAVESLLTVGGSFAPERQLALLGPAPSPTKLPTDSGGSLPSPQTSYPSPLKPRAPLGQPSQIGHGASLWPPPKLSRPTESMEVMAPPTTNSSSSLSSHEEDVMVPATTRSTSPPDTPSLSSEEGREDVAPLLFDGWRFPEVFLSRGDEKRLFEFQVRFGLRRDAASIIGPCRHLRNHLLHDYPAEVFLQRPQILRQLLASARSPWDGGADKDEDACPSSTASSGSSSREDSKPPTSTTVAIQALRSLRALSEKLVHSLAFHLDANFKTTVPSSTTTSDHQGGREETKSNLPHRMRYPQRAGEPSTGRLTPESQGFSSLSFCGGLFLIVESIIPLLATADARVVASSLRIIHGLLPFLLEPTAAAHSEATDLDLARLYRLLKSISKVCQAGTTPSQLTEPVTRLALELLGLVPPTSLQPCRVPPKVISLASQTLLRDGLAGYDGGAAREDLIPYVRALDPCTVMVLETGQLILDDAKAGLGILKPVMTQDDSSIHFLDLHGWLRSQLLRVQGCLGLLSVIPETSLVEVGVHLWMASTLGVDRAYLAREPLEGAEETTLNLPHPTTDELLAGELLLKLLSLSELGNRRAAYVALAKVFVGEEEAPQVVKVMMASADLRLAPPTPTNRGAMAYRGFLDASLSTSREALYHLLVWGIRQRDDVACQAAWTTLKALLMFSLDKLDRGDTGVVDAWVPFLPHLQAAREQAVLGEEETSAELQALGGGVSETLTNKLIQALLRHVSSEEALRVHCRDLFSHRPEVQVTAAQALRSTLSSLGSSVPFTGRAASNECGAPTASELEQHRHLFVQIFSQAEEGRRPPIFQEADIRNVANLLVTEQLDVNVRQAAAEQLCSMIVESDGAAAPLTPALVARVWAAVSTMLTSSGWLVGAGTAVLLALVWRHRNVRERILLHHEDGSLSILRFLPLLFDSQPLVRACLRACLVPLLFDVPTWTAAAHRPGDQIRRETSLDPPPYDTTFSVSCALGQVELEPPPTPRPTILSPPFLKNFPAVPDFVLGLFSLQRMSSDKTASGSKSNTWDNYGLLSIPLINPITTLPDLPTEPEALNQLVDAVCDGWLRLQGKASQSSSPQGLAVSAVSQQLLDKMSQAGSHKEFSLCLTSLVGWCVSDGRFRRAMLDNNWVQAMACLLQAPPVSKKDDQVFAEALAMFKDLLPDMASHDVTVMVSTAVDCIMPLLNQAFRPKHGHEGGHDAFSYEARSDLIDQCLDFLLALCHLVPPKGVMVEDGPVVVLARRTALAHILVHDVLDQSKDPLVPVLSMQGMVSALGLLHCLLPTILEQSPLPAFISSLGSVLLRHAGRLHRPDSFQGHAVIRGALRTLATALDLLQDTTEAEMFWCSGDRRRGPLPSSLFRFIADHDSVVRALCYRALKASIRLPWLLEHLCTTEEGDLIQAPPGFIDTIMLVMLDRSECPAIRAEAFGALTSFVQAYRSLFPTPQSPSEERMSALESSVFQIFTSSNLTSLITGIAACLSSSPSALSPALTAAALRALNVLALTAMESSEIDDDRWAGLFSKEEGGVGSFPSDALDAGLLIQLIWQQEIAAYAVKVIGAKEVFRTQYWRSAGEASGLPVVAHAPVSRRSQWFSNGGAGSDGGTVQMAAPHGIGGWDSLVESVWWEVEDQAACGAQADALGLVDLLLDWQDKERDRLLRQTPIISSLVACLEAYNPQHQASADGEPVVPPYSTGLSFGGLGLVPPPAPVSRTPSYYSCLLSKALGIAYKLFLPVCESSAMAAAQPIDYIPVPSNIPHRILIALEHILQSDLVSKDLEEEALSFLCLFLSLDRVRRDLVSTIPSGGNNGLCTALIRLYMRLSKELFSPASRKQLWRQTDTSTSNDTLWAQSAPSWQSRALASRALASLLDAHGAFRDTAHSHDLVGFLIRQLEDLHALRTITILRTSPPSKSKDDVQQRKTKDSATGKAKRSLKELNERLSGVGAGSRYTTVEMETCLVLEVMRAALVDHSANQSSAEAQGVVGHAIKIWPYALALEVDDPYAITRQKLLGAKPGLVERIKTNESLMELLLGTVINLINDHMDNKRSVVLTTARGKETDWPRTSDTLMHHISKLALRPDVRVEVSLLAMAFLRSMVLGPEGRKMMMQINLLNLKCAPTILKTLRNTNNRLLRPSELSPAGYSSLSSILQLFVNLTLAGEGQKALLQMQGLPDLLADLLEVFMPGRDDGDPQQVEQVVIQLCYLLRNLSFVRGNKARVLSSPACLSYLLAGMVDPSIKVRHAASVAIWSLLYHSEKSRAILRGLCTPSKLEEAEALLHHGEGGGEGCHDEEQEEVVVEEEEDRLVQLRSGIRRSLANIRVLIVPS